MLTLTGVILRDITPLVITVSPAFKPDKIKVRRQVAVSTMISLACQN
jgi:hypothetical protein